MTLLGQSEHIFIDLDRTLLDTDRFFRSMWDTIEEQHGLTSGQGRDVASDFYTYTGDMYEYDWPKQIRTLGLDVDETVQLVSKRLSSQRLLFPDAYEFIQGTQSLRHRMSILTFGGPVYQNLKASVAQELTGITIDCVVAPKAEFLREYGQPAVLIDDKLQDMTLMPPAVRFVHIDRSQSQAALEHDGFVSINSLTALLDQ